MSMKTVALTFLSPVHFGRGRLSDGAYSIDAATLFSALFIEAIHSGTHEALLKAARCGDLTISDTFPYIGDTYFLPKPILAPSVFDKRNSDHEKKAERRNSRERKANKKLAYISSTLYGNYLEGTFDSIAEEAAFNLGTPFLQTKVNLTRVAKEDADPYFVGGYAFNPGAGLYFLTQGDYNLIPLLKQLSYSGLGGKRTNGYGRFTFDVIDADPTEDATSHIERENSMGSSVLLSTSAPRSDELSDELLDGARYRLIRKSGFVQSITHSATPQKKRDMYLFAAGSTFVHTFDGDIYNVNAAQDTHPVYRYAKALWMEV